MRDRVGVILQAGLRELFEIGAAFVVRQVRRVGFEARGLERLAEAVKRPAAAKRAVHEHDGRYVGCALHAAARVAAPIRQTIILDAPTLYFLNRSRHFFVGGALERDHKIGRGFQRRPAPVAELRRMCVESDI